MPRETRLTSTDSDRLNQEIVLFLTVSDKFILIRNADIDGRIRICSHPQKIGNAFYLCPRFLYEFMAISVGSDKIPRSYSVSFSDWQRVDDLAFNDIYSCCRNNQWGRGAGALFGSRCSGWQSWRNGLSWR